MPPECLARLVGADLVPAQSRATTRVAPNKMWISGLVYQTGDKQSARHPLLRGDGGLSKDGRAAG